MSSSVSVPVADDYTAVWALDVVIAAPRVTIEDSRQVSPLSLWVLDRQLGPAPILKFRR